MAFTNFIPKVWSARLLEHLDKAHVYGALVNRDYEGDIKQYGDTVHINQIGAVTIKDYTKNTDIDAQEALSNTDQTLVINQAKYFNFQIDDIDKAQIKPELMNAATQRAAYALADTSDQYIAGLMAAGALGTVGSDASPITVTAQNAYEQLVALKVKLDEQNASDFKTAAIQMTVIYLISGLFDRLFIDWYWVGKTKAWIIPGTEDMMPYIYGKTLVGKWVSTLIGFPILAVLIAWVVSRL